MNYIENLGYEHAFQPYTYSQRPFSKGKGYHISTFKIDGDTGCPTKHDSWWIFINIFFHNLLSSLLRIYIFIKKIYIAWRHFIVKFISSKRFANEIHCKKVFNISYNIWKKTIKTICQLSYFVGYPVFGNLSRFQLIKNQQNCSNVRLISPWILKIQRKYRPHFRMLSHLNYSRLNYCSFELLHVVPRE